MDLVPLVCLAPLTTLGMAALADWCTTAGGARRIGVKRSKLMTTHGQGRHMTKSHSSCGDRCKPVNTYLDFRESSGGQSVLFPFYYRLP